MATVAEKAGREPTDVAAMFRRHHRDLIRLLRRRGVDAETAADLAQDAYLRLLASPASGRADNPRAYLFRIAANLVVDRARREARIGRLIAAETVLSELSAPEPSVEHVMISRQDIALLHMALSELPEAARAALAARVEGLTFAQIAERQGTTLRAAFDRTARAESLLRKRLRDGPRDGLPPPTGLGSGPSACPCLGSSGTVARA